MSEAITKRLELLLMPVADGAPTGIDLRTDTGHQSLYFRLKDARTAARAGERAAEAAGEPTGVPAEWRTVHELAQASLAQHSKDLEIAAWLTEALVRLEGFAGLELGFRLIHGLIDRYWADLHSVDRGDVAGKISPLAGLNGAGGEGTLIQPIRMVPLASGRPFGSLALWHHQVARRDQSGATAATFAQDIATAGPQALRDGERSARAALDRFQSLTAALENVCGSDAPPSSNTRNVLIEITDAYRALLGDTEPEPDVTAIDEPTVAAAPQLDGGVGDSVARDLRTREQAFAELLRIAAFFRKAEPHSPISYALETLVARGRMSLIDLLDELLPDAASRSQFLQIAGIGANAAGHGTD
jgi:type VI secretion system protein ImpA